MYAKLGVPPLPPTPPFHRRKNCSTDSPLRRVRPAPRSGRHLWIAVALAAVGALHSAPVAARARGRKHHRESPPANGPAPPRAAPVAPEGLLPGTGTPSEVPLVTALAVKLRGVITCAGSLIFFQDSTAGIFIDAPVSTKGRYQVGQYGDLEGYTAPGLFAPQIVPRQFPVLGTTALPEARPSKYDELSTGKLDSQRGEVEGIVRSVMPDERAELRRTGTLKMASDDGIFPVYVSDLPPDKLRAVVDASVKARGVVGGVFSERRQMIG